MSPLTKIFVVLLVIVSILQTAATVVWVNNVQPLQAQLRAAADSEQAAKSQAASAEAAAQQAQADAAAARTALEDQKQKDNVMISSVQGQLNKANVDNAQLQQDKATRDASIASKDNTVNVLTAQNTKLQQQVTDLRNSNDALTQRSAEDSRRIAELDALKETLTAKFDDKTEQMVAAASDMEKLKGALKDHGVDPDSILSGPAGLGASAIPINGFVRDVASIAGNPYATISVGTQDGVAKGMKFYLIDPNQGVLGIVTVDSVSPDQSTGQIRGDKVNLVQKGDVAKTQVRGN